MSKQQIESYLSGDLERQNREEGENILFQIEEFESAFNQGDVAAVGEFGIQIGAAYTRLQVTTVFEPEVRKKRNSSAGPSSRKGKSQSELWKWVREQKDWRTASPVALHKQAEARVEKIELDSFRRRLATLRKRAKVSDH